MCLTKSSIYSSFRCSTKFPTVSEIDQRYECMCDSGYSSANKVSVSTNPRSRSLRHEIC